MGDEAGAARQEETGRPQRRFVDAVKEDVVQRRTLGWTITGAAARRNHPAMSVFINYVTDGGSSAGLPPHVSAFL